MLEWIVFITLIGLLILFSYLFIKSEKDKYISRRNSRKNFKLTPNFHLSYSNNIIMVQLFLGGECIAIKNINATSKNIEDEIIKAKDELMEKLYVLYEDHKIINYLIEKHSTPVETSFTVEKLK